MRKQRMFNCGSTALLFDFEFCLGRQHRVFISEHLGERKQIWWLVKNVLQFKDQLMSHQIRQRDAFCWQFVSSNPHILWSESISLDIRDLKPLCQKLFMQLDSLTNHRQVKEVLSIRLKLMKKVEVLQEHLDAYIGGLTRQVNRCSGDRDWVGRMCFPRRSTSPRGGQNHQQEDRSNWDARGEPHDPLAMDACGRGHLVTSLSVKYASLHSRT